MKKHFYLSLFFFVIAFCSQAQIKKGDVLLGGDLGFSSQSVDNPANTPAHTNGTNISLRPAIGKAIKDNLLLGVDLGYTYNKFDQSINGVTTTSKTNTYSLGVFLRQYKPLGKGFSLFTQERVGGYYSKQTSDGTEINKSSGAALTFYPGIAYGITKRVQVETGLENMVSINYSHSSDPSGNKNNTFSMSTGLSSFVNNFVVGCRFLL